MSYRMGVTELEQHAYIKITVLRRRNAIECHSELVEAVPFRTELSQGGPLHFREDTEQVGTWNAQDD